MVPDEMLEENIRIDYNKLRMLIRTDKDFAHDASVIQTLVTQGYIVGELKVGFPAEKICDPDNFISLLYYFGMVTIGGTVRGKTKFVIPNKFARKQIDEVFCVKFAAKDTMLHRVVIVYRGVEMVVCKEV